MASGRLPFVGRLYLREYLALFGSFILIFLESTIRIATLLLPQPIIQFCYDRSKTVFNAFSSPQSRQSRSKRRTITHSIACAADFVDLCAIYGYYAEEHVVQTNDGYLLGLHRLACRKGEEGRLVNAGPGSLKKKVIYMHHGLLMNSEVWVCLTEKDRCLPFALVDAGYDVWLGNNRGNKYSKKSTLHSPTSTAFWDFSIDQFAFYDIPDSINYILSTTGQPSLSYIGFSQGTAQALAALSTHPSLNKKVNVFIGLAPAMSPAGLSNALVDAMIKASPSIIFLAFGRRGILSSAVMWQSILYPPIFIRLIDASMSFLFNWEVKNIATHQKLAAYPHLYSFTSTKSVVHWFQIIRTKSFQMYDDDVHAPFSIAAHDRYTKVAKFPTRNIKTPIVLVYGGSDSLVDIDIMLKELPNHTTAREVPHFEHLDFLWAQDVDTLVFPYVFDALAQYASDSLDLEGEDGTYSPAKFDGTTGYEPISPLAIRKTGETIRRGNRSRNKRTNSMGSALSLESTGTSARIANGGISIGPATATVGTVTKK
ncbi:MAG: cholesterol esterase [Cirrosporium novae-zelandiae]|nr:MAG: cholesterol esterase [Cirrosporium novae-zelandiae]